MWREGERILKRSVDLAIVTKSKWSEAKVDTSHKQNLGKVDIFQFITARTSFRVTFL